MFGRTESRPRRPWFRGREHELLEMNHEVTAKQRRADELHAAGARPEASPQEVALWQGAKRDLAASRRHKRRRLITWENWTQVGEQAERAEHRGDHYTLYSVMKQLRARGARAANMGEKEISGDPFAEAASWRQRFKQIQNGAEPVNATVWQNVPVSPPSPVTQLDTEPTAAEVKAALYKMKTGKAPGVDGVAAEMIKWGPSEMLDDVTLLVQAIWTQTVTAAEHAEADSWPPEWLRAIVIPLWKKKHPKTDKGNWRGVTLLSTGVKLLARIVAGRVQRLSEPFMDETQQGFRRNRGVDDVLQVTRRLTEEICFSRTGPEVRLTLYDVEKAYPRVCREALWKLMQRRGAPTGLIKICRALHDHTDFQIRVAGTMSDSYTADRGLKEGCPSSPPLFNLCHQAVLQDYRVRRTQQASSAGVQPGILWRYRVDGQLQKRGSAKQATRDTWETVLGDIECRRHGHYSHGNRIRRRRPDSGANVPGLGRKDQPQKDRNSTVETWRTTGQASGRRLSSA